MRRNARRKKEDAQSQKRPPTRPPYGCRTTGTSFQFTPLFFIGLLTLSIATRLADHAVVGRVGSQWSHTCRVTFAARPRGLRSLRYSYCTGASAAGLGVFSRRCLDILRCLWGGWHVFFATERRLFCDAHFCALPTHYLRTTSALFAHFLHFIECSRMQAAS